MAVVRILTPGKYPVIKFADSDRVEVGEMVVAIGNPFGYTETVTLGIVSAMDREITLPSGHTIEKLIQTDASIDPESSARREGGVIQHRLAGNTSRVGSDLSAPAGAPVLFRGVMDDTQQAIARKIGLRLQPARGSEESPRVI
jgi:Trypsin-like peptidase domain